MRTAMHYQYRIKKELSICQSLLCLDLVFLLGLVFGFFFCLFHERSFVVSLLLVLFGVFLLISFLLSFPLGVSPAAILPSEPTKTLIAHKMLKESYR